MRLSLWLSLLSRCGTVILDRVWSGKRGREARSTCVVQGVHGMSAASAWSAYCGAGHPSLFPLLALCVPLSSGLLSLYRSLDSYQRTWSDCLIHQDMYSFQVGSCRVNMLLKTHSSQFNRLLLEQSASHIILISMLRCGSLAIVVPYCQLTSECFPCFCSCES